MFLTRIYPIGLDHSGSQPFNYYYNAYSDPVSVSRRGLGYRLWGKVNRLCLIAL